MIKGTADKLTNSTNFLRFQGQHALIAQGSEEQQISEDKYHFITLVLNLANTFLYMVNTYIVVPTADDYTTSLGAAATVCGAILGVWSNMSYFRPLLLSSVVLLLGNVMSALAYDLHSLAILLTGRVLCGASALGMACGPAIAGLLQVNSKLFSFTIDQDTLPGWVMAFGWFVYLIWMWFSFKGMLMNGWMTSTQATTENRPNSGVPYTMWMLLPGSMIRS
ncbi:hypothetical protein BRADI_4g35545v3 [Brachypodium distachyon]|uniref:Uncharacterized protein n=1 Tax=Brachypodium distachyon TaxID=15368 RepID=A0A0Q3EXB5_BRADI|nr:hypothetical protein BRADI_4g35545v3 [Brachypodium distachyon]